MVKKETKVPGASEVARIMAANMRENQKDATFLEDRVDQVAAAAREALAHHGLARSSLTLEDQGTGARHELWSKTTCVVGRDAGADLRLDDPTVARHHARLTLADDRWSIEDVKSSAGTFVNGEIVRTPRPLRDGDVIQLSQVTLVVRLGAGGAGPATAPCP